MILNNGYKFIMSYQDAYRANQTIVNDYVAYDNTSESLYSVSTTGDRFNFFGWQPIRTSWYQYMDGLTYACSFYGVSNGTTYYAGNNSDNDYALSGVIFGDGDTEPSVNDYCLSGNMITAFAATTSMNRSISGGVIGVATYNITNTGSDPFTIKELGVSRAGNSKRVLLTRSILETPVTIAPGDTGVVIYKIEIS